ncbi:hypothetical protein BDR22DRAFT_591445 [Usnea florida]
MRYARERREKSCRQCQLLRCTTVLIKDLFGSLPISQLSSTPRVFIYPSTPSSPPQNHHTTALPTPRTSHHGLGAYFIQPVGEQKNPGIFSRLPCLLHPTILYDYLLGWWDYFYRQTFIAFAMRLWFWKGKLGGGGGWCYVFFFLVFFWGVFLFAGDMYSGREGSSAVLEYLECGSHFVSRGFFSQGEKHRMNATLYVAPCCYSALYFPFFSDSRR